MNFKAQELPHEWLYSHYNARAKAGNVSYAHGAYYSYSKVLAQKLIAGDRKVLLLLHDEVGMSMTNSKHFGYLKNAIDFKEFEVIRVRKISDHIYSGRLSGGGLALTLRDSARWVSLLWARAAIMNPKAKTSIKRLNEDAEQILKSMHALLRLYHEYWAGGKQGKFSTRAKWYKQLLWHEQLDKNEDYVGILRIAMELPSDTQMSAFVENAKAKHAEQTIKLMKAQLLRHKKALNEFRATGVLTDDALNSSQPVGMYVDEGSAEVLMSHGVRVGFTVFLRGWQLYKRGELRPGMSYGSWRVHEIGTHLCHIGCTIFTLKEAEQVANRIEKLM